MGFFDSIVDETIGRIPTVGGAFGGAVKQIGGVAGGAISKAGNLFSGLAGLGTNLVGGLGNLVSTPIFLYLALGGAAYLAYTLLKTDGSSNNNNYQNFSKPSSSTSAYVTALAQFTPQGRAMGFASKVASAYM